MNGNDIRAFQGAHIYCSLYIVSIFIETMANLQALSFGKKNEEKLGRYKFSFP